MDDMMGGKLGIPNWLRDRMTEAFADCLRRGDGAASVRNCTIKLDEELLAAPDAGYSVRFVAYRQMGPTVRADFTVSHRSWGSEGYVLGSWITSLRAPEQGAAE